MNQNKPTSETTATREKAVQLLRSLGLTGTEAEVYFTALQTCTSESVSSYKLAQTMGRDPANVAKTLGALVRLQAMTIVQDKPRLYLPVDPAAFTDRVLSRMQSHGREAVDLLQRFQAPEPDGVTLGLVGTDQIFSKVRELLGGCQDQALVFGSKESLRELGAELEELAENPDRTVRVLSPLAMVSDNVDIAVFSPLSDLAPLQEQDFLQVVVDNRAWLCAVMAEGRDLAANGCWSDHSPVAAVLAGTMTLAWHAGHSAQPAVDPVFEATAEPVAEPATEPTPTPAEPDSVAPAIESLPEPEAEKESLDFEEGITFLMRHDERQKAKEKGEQ